MATFIATQTVPGEELNHVLGELAVRLVEDGTTRHGRALELIAGSVSATNPGAAAALVDWTGAEVARLRAFGVAHAVVVARMAGPSQQRLLTALRGDDEKLAA